MDGQEEPSWGEVAAWAWDWIQWAVESGWEWLWAQSVVSQTLGGLAVAALAIMLLNKAGR